MGTNKHLKIKDSFSYLMKSLSKAGRAFILNEPLSVLERGSTETIIIY